MLGFNDPIRTTCPAVSIFSQFDKSCDKKLNSPNRQINYVTLLYQKMDATSSSPNTSANHKNIMNYRDLNDYLIKHKTNKENPKPITHTRIGDDKSGIYGGAFHIPEDDENEFFKLYAKEILRNRGDEYLTEKQLENNGPCLIDIDLKYDASVSTRRHSIDHVIDLIDGYLEILKSIYQFDESTRFKIFVMEKSTVNILKEKGITKDGIHIIFGLSIDRVIQVIMRDRILPRVAEMWTDLPLKTDWDAVFDEGITLGHTNWQLYGSKKPNHEPYQLKYIYEISCDPRDNELRTTPMSIQDFDIAKNIQQLSARYKEHPSLFMKNDFIPTYNEYKRTHRIGGSTQTTNTIVPVARTQMQVFDSTTMISNVVRNIQSKEELDMTTSAFIEGLSSLDYALKELYEYVMILPSKYYEEGEGNFTRWINVAFALKNTDERMLIVWIRFSAKAKNFKYSNVPDLCDRWNRFTVKAENALTKNSIFYWAKQDAPEEYKRIKHNSIDYFINYTISGGSGSGRKGFACGDFDLARVLYEIYKDKYVCVSVKSNIWYQFGENRWLEIDSGTTLRMSISTHMRGLYNKKAIEALRILTSGPPQTPANAAIAGSPVVAVAASLVPMDELCETIHAANRTSNDEDKKNGSQGVILDICSRLSKTNDKKNIMTEAKELFYDGTFLNNMDVNPYLLCCKNGVIDFKEKVFREGRPDDNMSLSTNIVYTPLDRVRDAKIIGEVEDFLHKLFPVPEVYNYMFDYLASTLIGTTTNQTFNMFIGGGSNGKSKLIDLMKCILGEYKCDVPLSLVTGDRPKIGGLAPEIVDLKGKRFAVMQEPCKGDKINEGQMKQLTGGDPVQARKPYCTQAVTFTPQFKLCVCSNTMMEIKSNDWGTWRRIRVVLFQSLFCENPVQGDPDKPYQYKVVGDIDTKFDSWKEVALAMFVERAFITNGFVADCHSVTAASNEYRASQDFVAEFVRDKVIVDPKGRITKTEINHEYTQWFAISYGRKSAPSPKDLYDYMDKNYGKQKNTVWTGVKIRYERDNYEIPDIVDDDDIGDADEEEL